MPFFSVPMSSFALVWTRRLLCGLAWSAQALLPVCLAQEKDYWDHMTPANARTLELQQQWWSIIEQGTGGDTARLTEMLLAKKQPAFFSPSCASPLIDGDFERLQQAYTTVLMSGVPNAPGAATGTEPRGRFLACLANSGADGLKARIDVQLLIAYKSPAVVWNPVMCQWTQNWSIAAEVYPSRAQMVWHESSGDVRRISAYAAEGTKSYSSFPNVLLHELVHLGGHHGEDLAYTATACCGDEVLDRAKACRALDTLVAHDRAAYSYATGLRRREHFDSLIPGLPWAEAVTLAHRFYSLLAKTLPELAAADDRAACVGRSGRAACKARAESALTAVLATLFPKECVDAVSGGSADLCATVGKPKQAELARVMADQLFPPP